MTSASTESIDFIRLNPGRSPDHNLDRNGADDGTDATAAIRATDIRPRDGNNGNGRRHSNMASLVGNPDLRKCETHHLLLIRWALKQPIREQSIPIENISSYDPFHSLDVNESLFVLLLGLDQVNP